MYGLIDVFASSFAVFDSYFLCHCLQRAENRPNCSNYPSLSSIEFKVSIRWRLLWVKSYAKKKTPEEVYAGYVGVSKNYVEWHWNVEQCINNKCRVCRRDGDALLNTLEDELHTRVPLLLITKLTSILPPYMLGVWGSSLKYAFRLY